MLPVLRYGLQMLLPISTRKVYGKKLKQVMSLPLNTPDPVVYDLSGILPVEAQNTHEWPLAQLRFNLIRELFV